MKFKIATITAAAMLASAWTASAAITLDVFASSAPNAFSSQSGWAVYAANALSSLENGLGTTGDRTVSPSAYEVAGPTIQPGDVMVTSFNSWMGVAGPLASPFNNEYGNRLHFGLHAYGDGSLASQFKLEDLTFAIHSSDLGDTLVYAGNFIGYTYNGTTRYGVNWGADRTKGGGDDIYYMSGNGTALVDELVYVGVGNAWWPGGTTPDQAAMDNAAAWMLGNAPLTITGQYWIQGIEGIDSVTVVPEPTTVIAGALLLLPFGMSTLRMLRKNRQA
ncbi:MAG: hypothetical protein IH623_12510 [Verrucomicrobia bacterium]|nr:hypothetical protein [Verrucomicrobiota bacterium]